jgi:hypothetical protein
MEAFFMPKIYYKKGVKKGIQNLGGRQAFII